MNEKLNYEVALVNLLYPQDIYAVVRNNETFATLFDIC